MLIVERVERLLDRLDDRANINTIKAGKSEINEDFYNGRALAYRRARGIVLEELGDILETPQALEDIEEGGKK